MRPQLNLAEVLIFIKNKTRQNGGQNFSKRAKLLAEDNQV
jgi:hypothetical protein